MTPTEHDTLWLELTLAHSRAVSRFNSANDVLLRAVGYRGRYNTPYYDRKGESLVLHHDALRIAKAELATHTARILSQGGTGPELLAQEDKAQRGVVEAFAALFTHEMKYTGWERYFLVTSSNGLIHRSTECPTCNKGRRQTEFALLPTLSGLHFSFALDVFGPSLCSVCWPEAPVEAVDGPKIPARIAELLFRLKPEAFFAELQRYQAKQAAKKGKS